MTPDVRLVGRISHYRADRGFGFIQPDRATGLDPRRRLFFHYSDAVPAHEITVGRRVRFEIGVDRQGRPQAERVVIEEAE